jgi:hypothetical protein
MQGHLPWSGAVANNAETFAEAAGALYEEKSRWFEAQMNGYKIINTLFLKEEHATALLQKLQTTISGLNNHRETNFTGKLLKQQQFAATKYMALWIEAKNKGLDKM